MHALAAEQARILDEDGVEVRSRQELHCYRTFRELFPGDAALSYVGRWAVA